MKHEYKFAGGKGRVISQNEQSINLQRIGQKGMTLDRQEAQELREALNQWLAAGIDPTTTAKEQKMVTMFCEASDVHNMPTLVLGMSQAAWDYCKDGMTHTLDLNCFGVPLHIILTGGRTQDEIISAVSAAQGVTVDDRRGEPGGDLGIKDPTIQ